MYHQAPADRIGTASGLLRTFQYSGAMLASAVIAAVFTTGATSAGLHVLALVMLGCALLLLAASLADRSLGRAGGAAPARR